MIEIILSIGIPLISGLVVYIVKSTLHRIETLENKMHTVLPESSVKELVRDKIEPIKEDIQEIKEKLDKVFDLLLEIKSNSGQS